MFLHQWLPGSHEPQLPPSLPPPLSLPPRQVQRLRVWRSGWAQDGGPVLRLLHSTSLLPHCELNISWAPTPASTCRLTAGCQHHEAYITNEFFFFFSRLSSIFFGSKIQECFFLNDYLTFLQCVTCREPIQVF